MKDRILLTGSNGFLGRIIFNHLKEMGNEVATINRSNGSYKFDILFAKMILHDSL